MRHALNTFTMCGYELHCHVRMSQRRNLPKCTMVDLHRSPAEGAYSEGFISSKLNQDFCIECPGTGSLFDFRSGEIKEWYPSNPVLRVLTPAATCRNLETYPVRLEQVRAHVFKAKQGETKQLGGHAAGRLSQQSYCVQCCSHRSQEQAGRRHQLALPTPTLFRRCNICSKPSASHTLCLSAGHHQTTPTAVLRSACQ